MPSRRPPASPAPPSQPANRTFRQRYDDIEARRTALVERLRMLGDGAQKHPGYKRTQTLLNDTFRKSKLGKRVAVLQAAAWLIDILEKLTTTL